MLIISCLGNFKIDDEAKSFEASFIRDKTNQVLVAKAGLNRLIRSKQQVYQPQLILTLSNRNITDLGGIFYQVYYNVFISLFLK